MSSGQRRSTSRSSGLRRRRSSRSFSSSSEALDEWFGLNAPILGVCTASRLAEVTMHRRIGAAKCIVQVSAHPDDPPVSGKDLEQLGAAFQAHGFSDLGDVPLGIHLVGRIGADEVKVIRAVAGCSHLSLYLVASSISSPVLLYELLPFHRNLAYLSITERALILVDLMEKVSQACTRLVTLDVRSAVEQVSDLQRASIFYSIASMDSLQHLRVALGITSYTRPEVTVKVLQLPRLSSLVLQRAHVDSLDAARIFSVLAKRSRPLRALSFLDTQFRTPAAARELLSRASLQVMRCLYKLELDGCADDVEEMDLFLKHVVPEMNRLRHLSLDLPQRSLDDWTRRVLAAASGLDRLSRLSINNRDVPLHGQRSLTQLESLLRAQTRGELLAHDVQLQLDQLSTMIIPASMSGADLHAVCHNLLPHCLHLTTLDFPSYKAVLTDALASVLADVLPRLPLLREFALRVLASQRHLLRQVFSGFHPYSLVKVHLTFPGRETKIVVPIEVMRASLSVQVDPAFQPHPNLTPYAYYRHPDHTDRVWPCAVPSLHDLTASVVLTRISPDRDLGKLPDALSRHSLREQLMSCDECGAYRRLADGFISVREKPRGMAEVLRCFLCYVRSPGKPFPYLLK